MSVFFCANIEGKEYGVFSTFMCLVIDYLRILLFSKLLLLRRRENSKKRMEYVCFSENIYAAITVLLKCKFR